MESLTREGSDFSPDLEIFVVVDLIMQESNIEVHRSLKGHFKKQYSKESQLGIIHTAVG